MGVVSVRLPDATEKILVRHGQKPGEVMKRAAEAQARRLEGLDRLASLGRHRAGMKLAARASEDVVREARDA